MSELVISIMEHHVRAIAPTIEKAFIKPDQVH